MSAERRNPAVRHSFDNMGGRGGMMKTPINLQDLRRKIYAKAKVDKAWRFWGLRARQRRGFGWARWSKRWLYESGAFRRLPGVPTVESAAPPIGHITFGVKRTGERS